MLFPTTLVGSYPQPDWLIDRQKLAGRFPPRVRAKELWREAAEEKLAPEQAERVKAAWRLLKQGGPRLAAMTRMVRTLDASYGPPPVGESDETDAALAKAKEMTGFAVKFLSDAKAEVVIKAPEPVCVGGG